MCDAAASAGGGCDIPTLKEINTDGCNIATPPQAICDQGLDAMRRYWAEVDVASTLAWPMVTISISKVVLLSHWPR